VFVLHISSSELPASATDRGKVYSPYYFVLDLRLNIMIAHVVAIEFAVVIRLEKLIIVARLSRRRQDYQSLYIYSAPRRSPHQAPAQRVLC
jgi:hypothetical protein